MVPVIRIRQLPPEKTTAKPEEKAENREKVDEWRRR
jgi:hypothetical protein